MVASHFQEVKEGNRFTFGENWAQFLKVLDEKRILRAENSLCKILKLDSLAGKSFIDIGSGSGLFSLAARRLGAKVHSFDFDPESVACTAQLKKRYFPDDTDWVVESGSALDTDYLNSLGKWDIVYSWGVLHHTGDMYGALENAANLVADDGSLFIAIYNDQGRPSKYWLSVKNAYNKLPKALRWLILWPSTIRLWGPTTLRDLLKGRPFYTWRNYPKISSRGMSPWRDVVDWVGGLPFEVAKPDQIFHFFQKRGFQLTEMKTDDGHGCNEFVFRRSSHL